MKLNITYWTKKELYCPTCKSDRLVFIFFKHDNMSKILSSIDTERVRLVSSDIPNKELEWLCKNCYDIGEILLK